MEEKITLRLYKNPEVQAKHHEGMQYHPTDDTKGWEFEPGDQVGVTDPGGGFLYAVIDHIDRTVNEDEDGPYRLATACVED